MRPDAVPVVLPDERTDTGREVDAPDSARESRPETDRRDVDEREEDRADAPEAERCEPLSPPRVPAPPPPATPVGGELTIPVGDTTGASPHVSQYSSPPPMSS
ncbi:hypothetical protein DT87_08710 [Streptomyces sp. NTK 937]|nr:hypothetical protein DT87_08710 [Streptomyces sp. NTK 937]